ncbi:MAG TPA: MFS transporter [Planctomycetota bacterium]|nr:MFS transporter [Planctomycetota bacterium]
MSRVLRVIRNPQFAKLWLSQFVSQTGDWLDRVACLVLIGRLGSASSVFGVGVLFGLELALRLLPSALFSPLAGPIADRLPRRMLMIVSDLARAAIVLCFLLVREPSQLTWLYVLIGLQMAIGIFFDAARSAALPETVKPDELHDAYALSAVTWSITLCAGALAGGWVVEWVGISGAFVVDSASYVLSALFLIGLRLPPVPKHAEPFRWGDIVRLTDLRRGLTHARKLGVTPILWTKSFWGGAGGFLVLLSLAGRDQFGSGASDAAKGLDEAAAIGATAVATGWLYFARGIGTGLGPLLANLFFGKTDPALKRQITAGFVIAAIGYALFGSSHSLWIACVFVAVAHTGGSTLWVASTVLWQKHVENAYRGRVFVIEFLALDLAFSAGGMVGGLIYDATGSLSLSSWIIAGLVLLLGSIWTWTARNVRGPERAVEVVPAVVEPD